MTPDDCAALANEVADLLECDERERGNLRVAAGALLATDAFGRPLRDNLIRIVVMNLRDRAGEADADLRMLGWPMRD